MKLSKSKLALAKVINENGGWKFGEFAWYGNATKSGYFGTVKPTYNVASGTLDTFGWIEKFECTKIVNWHQTILSREEYYQAYPKADADGWIEWNGGECPVGKDARIDIRMTGGKTYYDTGTHWGWNADSFKITHYRLRKPEVKPEFCESVMRSIPELGSIDGLCSKVTSENKHQHVDAKPTIEQLAADYRNAKGYADFKQQEADAAKADADEKLRVLEIAGEAHGLLVTPITAKQEPEMVIAVQVGDKVRCIKSIVNPGKYMGRIGTVSSVDVDDTLTPYLVEFGGEAKIWCHEVKFILRP